MSEAGYERRNRFPPVLFALVAAIVGAYAWFSFQGTDQQNLFFYNFALIPVRFDESSPYHFNAWYEALGPLFGHVFLHAGILHIGMNMLMLMQVGPWVAQRLGGARFLALFFLSALGGGAAYLLINAHAQTPAVGASGAICGVFGAYFFSVRPSWRDALADPQVRNAIGVFLFINVILAGVASATGFLPIAWEAHLGGFVAGILAYFALAPRVNAGPWSAS